MRYYFLGWTDQFHAAFMYIGCISKKPAGNIRKKIEMIPGANIISGKARVASVNRAGGSEPFSRAFRGWSPLRKFFGSKEHLDWLKKDLNAVRNKLCSRLYTHLKLII